MALHCCVPLCTSDSRYDIDKKLSFHNIPKDEKLRREWIVKIRRDENALFQITEATHVCCLHFNSNDFKKTLSGMRRLKNGSVPSLFNWTTCHEERPAPKQRLPFNNYRCISSCVALTTAVSTLLQNDEKYKTKKGEIDVDAIIEHSYQYASRCMINCTYQELKELRHYMKATSLKELKLTEAGQTSHTFKTLGAAFWALKQKNFRQAITDIIMEGGDADANASAAGALLGCKLGVNEIPNSWIETLEHRLWLDKIIDSYFHMMEGGKFKPKVETTV